MMKLLADRGSGSISVRLFWNEAATAEDADLVIEYEDLGEGLSYVLHPPRDRALDAFYHPNAYLKVAAGEAA